MSRLRNSEFGAAAIRTELTALVTLAWPIVVGELGWATMGLVDTAFVGRLSTAALAGVSLGSILFYSVSIFGFGLLLGLDTVVSQAYGAGEREECDRWVVSGLWLAVISSPILMAAVLGLSALAPAFGVQPEVVREAQPYLFTLNFSLPALLIFTALRRYLQSMDIVRPVMLLLVSANIINAIADWAFVFGHLGLPAMGAAGAGWATTASRLYMVIGLVAYVAWKIPHAHISWKPDWKRLMKLVKLGLPAGTQITLEVSLFAVAAALIGRLPTLQLAAHQVALNVVSYTFMVPLGLGSAAAVRVGQAVGRQDPIGARRSGWTAIALGATFMTCAGIAFLAARYPIARLFTDDGPVVNAAATMLIAGAAFQLFDGMQAVSTGALRGVADTVTPMIVHLVGYWFAGLPVGYWLCFNRGWGALGIWVGFCAALMIIGLTMATMWHRKSRALSIATPVGN